MKEERSQILNMLSEGKITPEEAEKLLSAAEKQERSQTIPKTIDEAIEGKFFYVQVEPKEGKSSDRVSVKVPMALLKAGLNIAGLIPKDTQAKINESMREKGMSFDITQINPENIQELMDSLELLTVDVDSEDATIQVYCR